jgi:GT2 family glycosyltransferase
MPQSPTVYIVLVNYKGWKDTIECLESLFKMPYPNFKVVVVDNDSQDGSLATIAQWADGTLMLPFDEEFYTQAPVASYPIKKPIPYQLLEAGKPDQAIPNPRLYLVQSAENLGFAGGNNVGIRLAMLQQADYVWLLNNDTVVEPSALNHLVGHYESAKQPDSRLGILGAKLLYYHNPKLVQAVLGRYKPLLATTEHIGHLQPADTSFEDLQPGQNDYIVGASMFVSAAFIREVGLMAEEYFLYFEELDWVKRGLAKNYTIALCAEALVYHKEGASIGGGMKDNDRKSALSDFYSIRNRLIITRKYYKKYLPSVYFSLLLVAANRVKRKQLTRIPLLLKAFRASLKITA